MRRFMLLGSFVVIAMVSNSARAQSCPGVSPWVFDDVAAADPFCGFITWMAQNGVSLGCQIIDANHRLYCPNTAVPRSQMAAFMNRLTTQPDTTSPTTGTITKPGGVFLHNFGTNNTFLGVGAGNFTVTGAGNTAVGRLALAANATGGANVAVGAMALPLNTTGFANTALGFTALANNTTGTNNTAGGAGTLAFNTVGNNNTGFGQSTLHQNTSGGNNAAFGNAALVLNTTGDFNTGIGIATLAANTTSSNSTAVGANALLNSTGQGNTAVGAAALIANTSGNNNIAIGPAAGSAATTGSNNIYVAHAGAAAESQTIRLGDASQNRTFIAGIRGIATGANDAVAVVIDSNGQLGTVSSSRITKDDIADMGEASAALMQLRPVTFHYKSDQDVAGARLQYGLIAEEVAEVYPGMVATKDGKPETVMYQYLAPMLLNEVQKQQRTIDHQAHELAAEREARVTQAREIAELRKALESLSARVGDEAKAAQSN